MISSLDFHLDDGGLDAFPPLPLTLKGPGEDDGHLDFLKDFHTGDVEGPTSSSSDADGSSARASEATPGQQEYQYGCPAVSSVHSSWHMAPQLVSVHADGAPASAPVMYGAQAQHQQWQQQQPAIWHSAFAGATAAVQQQQQQQTTSKESKVTVSHSTIEKQRRDRINSLIDELRDLVPPSTSMKSPDGGDVKRPKHTVLADTIQLLKLLKDKVQQDEYERQRLQQFMQQQQHMVSSGMVAEQVAPAAVASGPPAAGWANHGIMPISLSLPAALPETTTLAGAVSQSAQSLLQHSLSASLSSQTIAAASNNVFAPSSCPDLPQAPANLPSAVGVLVEEGPGSSFLVKVNCRDRHGLLSDITQALCNLPLQIARAAITTSNGGAVYDVFEIVAEPSAGHEPVTALDVQFHVHQALYRWKSANPAAAAAADQQNAIAIGKRQRL